MKRILVLGAGKSATDLISYLLSHARQYDWEITVADMDKELIESKLKGHPSGKSLELNILEDEERRMTIRHADFVISLLPPSLHYKVAKDCLEFGKNLITASYISEEMRALHTEAVSKGILFLNEMGADPGLDHMSAVKIIKKIKDKGGKIRSFKSYCGGLVAKKSDDNPWHYKISWNPMNIVRAGSAGAVFLKEKEMKQLSYAEVFEKYEIVDIPSYGLLAAYANRDSLGYSDDYDIEDAETIIRYTLRHENYCKAWDIIVRLGLTDDMQAVGITGKTYDEWFMETAVNIPGETPVKKIFSLGGDEETVRLIQYLGLIDRTLIDGPRDQTSAEILKGCMSRTLKLDPDNADLLLMHHEFIYEIGGVEKTTISTLHVEGVDHVHTAMSQCVGLPLAVFTKLFLETDIIQLSGVHIPTFPEIYEPVLEELENLGIRFEEKEI